MKTNCVYAVNDSWLQELKGADRTALVDICLIWTSDCQKGRKNNAY